MDKKTVAASGLWSLPCMTVGMWLLLLLMITSQTTFRHVDAVQRFSEEPQDVTLSQGQVHILRCTVEDQVGPVQWLRDGFGLGPGPEFEGYPRYRVLENPTLGEYHLRISDIQLEDDALFECQVGATVSSPGLKSNKAKLDVLLPPESVFIEGTSILQVIAGEKQAIACNAIGGKPAAVIRWETDGEVISDDVEYNISVQVDGKREDAVSKLNIIPSKSDQGKELFCEALNDAMIEPKREKVTLEVLYKPELSMTLDPNSRLIKEFGSLKLTCSAVGNPSSIHWKWYSNDEVIPGETSPVLVLSSLRRDLHGKQFSCEAENGVGATRITHTLDVEYGPRFASEAENPAADPGDSVTLSCNIDSNPPAAVVWRKKGSNRILSSQTIYQISSVEEEHFAAFTCTASLIGYEPVSRDIHIIRKGPPNIVSYPEQQARYGDTGAVECKVFSIPKPNQIIWKKNGEVLDLNDLKRYRIREEDLNNGRQSTIEIVSVQDEDYAVYNCTAQNDYGSDHLAITFTKKEVLPWLYILIAVLSGVLIIVVISVVCFLYHRKRARPASVSNSQSSTDSINIKKKHQPDLHIEFTSDIVDSSSDKVDSWQNNLSHPSHYSPPPAPVEYDELQHPAQEPLFSNYNPEDYDRYGYGQHSLARDFYPKPRPIDNPYGTYQHGMHRPYNLQYNGGPPYIGGPVYGSDIYAPYATQPRYGYPRYDDSNRSPLPPPSPADSKLSTNV